jgi:4-amino-4-deoxy-L-arabinose transferase-like glycosyltransferase
VSGQSRRSGLIAIVALYLLTNIVIWIFANPGARLEEAADAGSWYRPALALMAHGGFVDLNDPTRIDTYRPPLYPLFEAAAMTVAGGPNPGAVAIAQIVLLLLVGLLFRDVVRDWMPGWENLGMALLVFNPNVLSSAQFVQSEILFLAFTTLTFWGATKYARGGREWRYALLTGLGVALACLTRPTAQFLLFALPILFPLLAAIRHRVKLHIALAQGIAALTLAFIVLAPWVSLVAAQGHGLALSDSAGKYRYVWDQVVMIEAQTKGLSYHDAEARLSEPGGAQHDFIEKQGAAWETLPTPERNKALAGEGMTILLSYPTLDFAKALYRSVAQFFFAGGAGNWHNLFGIGAESLSEAWFTNAQDDLWNLLKRLFEGVPLTGLIFSAIAIGFAILTRVIGLIGLISFFNRDRLGLLLVISGFVSYFALIHVFVGNSRYRVSVEPMLMLLFLSGLNWLRDRFRRA